MPYKISIKALEKNDSVFFKSMLHLVQRQLSAEWEFAEVADITVVDVEQTDGKRFWEQAINDKKCVIAYARHNIYDAQWFLPKPIRVQPLITLLNTLLECQNHASQIPLNNTTASQQPLIVKTIIESLPPLVPQIPETSLNNANNNFDPTQYLLGLLQKAIQTKKIQRFSCAGLPPVYISPTDRRCFTNKLGMSLSQLSSAQKMMYGAYAEHIDSTELSIDMLLTEVDKNNLVLYPIETLLWITTLSASHGRLIVSYPSRCSVRLKQWPNFAVLPHQPSHMNLAAFMLKNGVDLPTVAAKTQVELNVVIDFFNACQVLGLTQTEEKHNPQQEKSVSGAKRHLFRGILKRLMS
ncbi:hypothetical protein [Beggiatoa leptomitoformis]|uniref:Uncharacterized protein n=1 Tax=Beggiatoa leptomitoformis TaxID=288004 RepID=A0A2N9Y9W5_9GAMM|nr:hypothetical protein [Beggiatoa leptomitoformis]ALG67310.2 hypothetical protein AL038_05825 [Beggiatoa leptomitoformis]AUI67256.2 hypothetical protein BLE401_00145 [Beggiatoa leptomitoformis]